MPSVQFTYRLGGGPDFGRGSPTADFMSPGRNDPNGPPLRLRRPAPPGREWKELRARIYFDQLDQMTQLGLIPAPTAV